MAKWQTTLFVAIGVAALLAGCQSLNPDTAPSLSPASIGPIYAHPLGKWSSTYRLENSALSLVVVPDTGRIHHVVHADAGDQLWHNEHLGNMLKSSTDEDPDAGGMFFLPSANARMQWDAKAWLNEDGSQVCHLTTHQADERQLVHSVLISLQADAPMFTVAHRMTRVGYSKTPITFLAGFHVAPDRLYVIPADRALRGQSTTARLLDCGYTAVLNITADADDETILLPENWVAAFIEGRALSIANVTDGPLSASVQFRPQPLRTRVTLRSEGASLAPGRSQQVKYAVRVWDVGDWPDPCDTGALIGKRIRR